VVEEEKFVRLFSPKIDFCYYAIYLTSLHPKHPSGKPKAQRLVDSHQELLPQLLIVLVLWEVKLVETVKKKEMKRKEKKKKKKRKDTGSALRPLP